MIAWRRPATSTRPLAALALLVFAFGNLGSLIHQATTRHTKCPEHGELVHGDERRGAEPGTGAVPARMDGARDPASPPDVGDVVDPARIRAQALSSSHEHDHCTIVSPTRERMAAAAAHGPLHDAPWASRALLAIAAGPGSPGGALYRTAPKTSPPA